jgi:hypothetical protein
MSETDNWTSALWLSVTKETTTCHDLRVTIVSIKGPFIIYAGGAGKIHPALTLIIMTPPPLNTVYFFVIPLSILVDLLKFDVLTLIKCVFKSSDVRGSARQSVDTYFLGSSLFNFTYASDNY